MDQERNPTTPSAAGELYDLALHTTALTALAEAVYIVDAAGHITWANTAFERLTGYALAEVEGRPSTRYYVPEDETLFVARRRLVQQGTAVAPTLDAVFIHKDGAQVPVELAVSSLLRDGRVAGRLTVLRPHRGTAADAVAGSAPVPLEPAAPRGRGTAWRHRILQRYGGQAAGVVAGGLGGLVLVGWAVGSQRLISLLPGWPVMVPNTALLLLLAGLSLWQYHRHVAQAPCGEAPRPPLAVQGAALVLLLGLLTLSQYLGGWDLGLDRWFFAPQLQRYSAQAFPGRMSAHTALSGVFLGGALLLVHGWGRRYLTLAHGGALAAAGIAWLALLGYVYHTTFYASPGRTGMAVHTALTVLLLSAGLLGAQPTHGLMAGFAASTTGGVLVRRMLPAVIVLPVALGLLHLWGEHAGLLTILDGVAFVVVSHTLLLLGLVLYTARQLSGLDTRRRQAEAALRQTHDTLEQRVQERTAALALDIAARQQAEAALRELNATLEQRVAERTAALAETMAAQQRLEREAQRAAHFSLLGRLAAGVSHELRNPLGAVFLNVELLDEELRDLAPEGLAGVTESLAEIKTHLARVEDLMEDYLTLVRVGALEQTVQDLGAALQGWAAEFQALAAAQGMALQAEGLAALGTAAFHANTLRRALLNLVQNGLEAMPPGGTLTLHGRRTATHVELQVADAGSGIPAERLQQIFEPLHTTKPGGTGLGLYIVQEIIAAHGGQIAVASVVGQGTTFTLSLPRVTLQSTPAHTPLEEAYQFGGRS